VPQFPAYYSRVPDTEKFAYKVYMQSFREYAVAAIAAQSGVAQFCAEKGGFDRQKVELENLMQDMRGAVSSVAETSAMLVSEEVKDVTAELRKVKDAVVQLERFKDVAVSDVETSVKLVSDEVKSVAAELRCVKSVLEQLVKPSCVGSVGVEGGGVGEVIDGCSTSGTEPVVETVRRCTPGAFGKPVVPSQVRGPNWERNCLMREEKKNKKKRQRERREKLSSESWRSKGMTPGKATGVKVVEQETRRGFFSELGEDTKKRLRESRARMMIAENERKTKEAEEKLKYLESPLALLATAMKTMRVAEQCAEKQGDHRIAGWARTVADSYAESVAKSAPSSVPSLESVKSTVSGDDRKAARRAEYVAEKKKNYGVV